MKNRKDREIDRFEEIISRSCKRLRTGEICVFAIYSSGKAVPIATLKDWVADFQDAVYRVGEYLLGLPARRRGKVRMNVLDKFQLHFGETRPGGAYGIRLSMGSPQLALSDFSAIQNKTLLFLREVLTTSGWDCGKHRPAIRRSVKLLQSNPYSVERVCVIWRGGGFVLDQDGGCSSL
jgi:hypothetical protein